MSETSETQQQEEVIYSSPGPKVLGHTFGSFTWTSSETSQGPDLQYTDADGLPVQHKVVVYDENGVVVDKEQNDKQREYIKLQIELMLRAGLAGVLAMGIPGSELADIALKTEIFLALLTTPYPLFLLYQNSSGKVKVLNPEKGYTINVPKKDSNVRHTVAVFDQEETPIRASRTGTWKHSRLVQGLLIAALSLNIAYSLGAKDTKPDPDFEQKIPLVSTVGPNTTSFTSPFQHPTNESPDLFEAQLNGQNIPKEAWLQKIVNLYPEDPEMDIEGYYVSAASNSMLDGSVNPSFDNPTEDPTEYFPIELNGISKPGVVAELGSPFTVLNRDGEFVPFHPLIKVGSELTSIRFIGIDRKTFEEIELPLKVLVSEFGTYKVLIDMDPETFKENYGNQVAISYRFEESESGGLHSSSSNLTIDINKSEVDMGLVSEFILKYIDTRDGISLEELQDAIANHAFYYDLIFSPGAFQSKAQYVDEFLGQEGTILGYCSTANRLGAIMAALSIIMNEETGHTELNDALKSLVMFAGAINRGNPGTLIAGEMHFATFAGEKVVDFTPSQFHEPPSDALKAYLAALTEDAGEIDGNDNVVSEVEIDQLGEIIDLIRNKIIEDSAVSSALVELNQPNEEKATDSEEKNKPETPWELAAVATAIALIIGGGIFMHKNAKIGNLIKQEGIRILIESRKNSKSKEELNNINPNDLNKILSGLVTYHFSDPNENGSKKLDFNTIHFNDPKDFFKGSTYIASPVMLDSLKELIKKRKTSKENRKILISLKKFMESYQYLSSRNKNYEQ